MNLIEKVKAHNTEIKNQVIEIEVSEWETTLYLSPVTVAEQHKITRLSPNGKDLEINILIEKAKDKEGNKIFKLDDKQELRKVPLSLMNRILSPVLTDINKPQEEIEKN